MGYFGYKSAEDYYNAQDALYAEEGVVIEQTRLEACCLSDEVMRKWAEDNYVKLTKHADYPDNPKTAYSWYALYGKDAKNGVFTICSTEIGAIRRLYDRVYSKQ